MSAESFQPEHDVETLIERRSVPAPRFSLIDDMIVSKGSRADWDKLHELHYKAEGLPAGPHYWKLTLHGETIGVLVTASPKGLLKERHVAFPRLKPGGDETKVTNTHRYLFINQNFRVIARFVVDTMYRGIGCGYRMMNLVSRMEGNNYMEIQSSMSKFNLFGQKAGFSFVHPMNAAKFEVGMKFFRLNFDASPQDFEALIQEIDAKPEGERELFLQSCRDFYYRHSAQEKIGKNRGKGQGAVNLMPARLIIKNIQQIVLSSPMYGVWKNPDPKMVFPPELPLTAFDWQDPRASFDRSRL